MSIDKKKEAKKYEIVKIRLEGKNKKIFFVKEMYADGSGVAITAYREGYRGEVEIYSQVSVNLMDKGELPLVKRRSLIASVPRLDGSTDFHSGQLSNYNFTETHVILRPV